MPRLLTLSPTLRLHGLLLISSGLTFLGWWPGMPHICGFGMTGTLNSKTGIGQTEEYRADGQERGPFSHRSMVDFPQDPYTQSILPSGVNASSPPSSGINLTLGQPDTSGQRHCSSQTRHRGIPVSPLLPKPRNSLEFVLSLLVSAMNCASSFPITRSHQGATGLGKLGWEGLSQQEAGSEQDGGRGRSAC